MSRNQIVDRFQNPLSSFPLFSYPFFFFSFLFGRKSHVLYINIRNSFYNKSGQIDRRCIPWRISDWFSLAAVSNICHSDDKAVHWRLVENTWYYFNKHCIFPLCWSGLLLSDGRSICSRHRKGPWQWCQCATYSDLVMDYWATLIHFEEAKALISLRIGCLFISMKHKQNTNEKKKKKKWKKLSY